jgi:hypothetical protein
MNTLQDKRQADIEEAAKRVEEFSNAGGQTISADEMRRRIVSPQLSSSTAQQRKTVGNTQIKMAKPETKPTEESVENNDSENNEPKRDWKKIGIIAGVSVLVLVGGYFIFKKINANKAAAAAA